jgi:hypothetical protein
VALAADRGADADPPARHPGAALLRAVDVRLVRAAREIDRAGRDGRAAQQAIALTDEHLVLTRCDGDAHDGAARLLRLGDDRPRALELDERLALERGGQIEQRLCPARI